MPLLLPQGKHIETKTFPVHIDIQEERSCMFPGSLKCFGVHCLDEDSSHPMVCEE